MLQAKGIDLKKIFILDQEKKEFVEIDLLVDFEKLLPPEAKQMMQVTAKVIGTE